MSESVEFPVRIMEHHTPPPCYEHRCELIPLVPGPAGDTARILNAWGAKGWRLVSASPVPARTRSELDIRGAGEELGLLVILAREA